jgi:hypothetical protein
MANNTTKILIRRGTDVQRRTTNNGIIFGPGEPAWCTDTKRLFVGDNSTRGGFPVGVQNLGKVSSLFGSSTNGFSVEALNVFNNKGASVGDFIFSNNDKSFYTLSGVSSFPPLSADFIKYDFTFLVDSTSFEFVNNLLTLKSEGVPSRALSLAAFDQVTIGKSGINAPVSLKNGGVQNIHLAQVPANSVKLNNSNTTATLNNIPVGENQVVGRITSSVLSAIPFSAVVSNANFVGTNGITIQRGLTGISIGVDSTQMQFTPTGILSQVDFTAINDLVSLGNLAVGQSTSITGELNVLGSSTFKSIAGTYLYVNGNGLLTGDLFVGGTIVNPSDIEVKTNIKVINSPLEKISKIRGYNYTLIENNKDDTGLIAQEVEQVIPCAVVDIPNSSKGVAYLKIIPLLVECIHELRKEINELRSNR